MSLYEPNYPPHGKSEIVTDGDSKKNIVNRERKEQGKPDAGTKGRESRNIQNLRSDKKFENERKESLAREADLADERLERNSDRYESQMEQEEETFQNKNTGEEGDFADFKEAMSEIDELHEEAVAWNNKHLGATSAELEEILREEKKRRDFSDGAGSKVISRGVNKVKHFRG